MVKRPKIDDISLYRRKGQYILMDEEVIHRQIDHAELTKNETVLEIGPGLGALTFKLAQRAGKVVAIEKDSRMFSYLKARIPANVELVNADVLEMDPSRFDVVVSNLPYQISSPVTFWLLNHSFNRAILMFQKEFAQRMVAKCGEKSYSRLSVNVYYKAESEILEFVAREAFYPVPEVDSAIVKLVPRKAPFSVISEETFFKVVDSLFGQRRKKIKNSLMNLVTQELRNCGIYTKSSQKEIIQGLPFLDERVEKLSPERIGILADNLDLSISRLGGSSGQDIN
ncbi:MAG: 16S rRNA (adenine(1518)-N(6)/adenine(1519)-N(6))-dimethyltransferase RsmA [Thermoplasmata archaeon]